MACLNPTCSPGASTCWANLWIIQVCESFPGEEVFEREVAPLREVKDAFPKIVLTLGLLHCGVTEDGIAVKNLVDWLLEE